MIISFFLLIFSILIFCENPDCFSSSIYCVGDGQEHADLKTVIEAIHNPGDKIFVKSGNYHLINVFTNANGTNGNLIEIQPFPNEIVNLFHNDAVSMIHFFNKFWWIHNGEGDLVIWGANSSSTEFTLHVKDGIMGPFTINSRVDETSNLILCDQDNDNNILLNEIIFNGLKNDVAVGLISRQTSPGSLYGTKKKIWIKNCIFKKFNYGIKLISGNSFGFMTIEKNYFFNPVGHNSSSILDLQVLNGNFVEEVVFQNNIIEFESNDIVFYGYFNMYVYNMSSIKDVYFQHNTFICPNLHDVPVVRFSRMLNSSIFKFIHVDNNFFMGDCGSGSTAICECNSIDCSNEQSFDGNCTFRNNYLENANTYVSTGVASNWIETDNIVDIIDFYGEGEKPVPFYRVKENKLGLVHEFVTDADFDGKTRSTTTPTVGAFEFVYNVTENSCPLNWDSSTNCSTCLNQYYNQENDCGSCPSNFDQNCETCIDFWIGEMCNICPLENGNGNCSDCESFWMINSNCSKCSGNRNKSDSCVSCVKFYYNLDNDCNDCMLENANPNCDSCINDGWDILTNCSSCYGNRDPFLNCTKCKDYWVEVSSECDTCGLENSLSNCTGCISDRWSLESNCTQCSGYWEIGSNCTTCRGNRDEGYLCISCKYYWYDLNNDCDKCMLGVTNRLANCTGCSGHWTESSNCSKCSGNRNDLEGCVSCLDYYYDLENDCDKCMLDVNNKLANCTGCLGHWTESSNCTGCRGNRNDLEGCVSCLGYWYDLENDCDKCMLDVNNKLANCTGCLGHFTESSNCSSCEGNRNHLDGCMSCFGYWYDLENNCDKCMLVETRKLEDCSGCIDHWTPSSNCTECYGNRDPATNCSSCIDFWTDIDNNCNVCLFEFPNEDCSDCENGYLDLSSNCTLCTNSNRDFSTLCVECRNFWSGPNCDICNLPYQIKTDCQLECAGNLDIQTNCTTCLYHWDEIDSDCTICPQQWSGDQNCNSCSNHFDRSTNCTKCLNLWSGELCNYCHKKYNLNCDGCIDDELTLESNCTLNTVGDGAVAIDIGLIFGIIIPVVFILIFFVVFIIIFICVLLLWKDKEEGLIEKYPDEELKDLDALDEAHGEEDVDPVENEFDNAKEEEWPRVISVEESKKEKKEIEDVEIPSSEIEE